MWKYNMNNFNFVLFVKFFYYIVMKFNNDQSGMLEDDESIT